MLSVGRAGSPRVVLAALALAVGLGLAAAPSSRAEIYWATNSDSSNYIARASNDGTQVDTTFISLGTAASTRITRNVWSPLGLAIGAGRLFWANWYRPTVGRATLSGTGINEYFVHGRGVSGPADPVVQGRYLYFVNGEAISRVGLNGRGLKLHFITAPHRGTTYYVFQPAGLASDGRYLYFGDTNSYASGQYIARVHLDRSHLQLRFMRVDQPVISMTVHGSYLYWTYASVSGIGRSALSGAGINEQYIPDAATSPGGCQLAFSGNYIYWDDQDGIGRSGLDGSNLNNTFINAPHGFLSPSPAQDCGLVIR